MVREGVRIAVDDDPRESDNMLAGLVDVLVQIDAELSKPGRIVVVHCLAAVSRSPCVVCAYFIWKYGMSVRDAIRRVQSVRQEAFMFSSNFQTTLEFGVSVVCDGDYIY